MSIEYAIVIKNKTRLENLIERFNTRSQAKFYIESMEGTSMIMFGSMKSFRIPCSACKRNCPGC